MNNEENNIQNEPISENLDFNNPSFVFTPKETHEWRQKGFFLVCKSCEITHATYIGPDKIIVGISSDGLPLLKNRN